ncbi:rhamnulokinase [Erwinia sorbitola]|uniref:Rhamnulokinase n=1 Tax=Erwinia sorbitola TaxID=2681984 RepID=A0A6I6ECH0_9GAMM|nr:rhamnulokinase [Erwinia sorbitola]QGU87497.1 rhamnulokinase [Erwinia sorbitola]
MSLRHFVAIDLGASSGRVMLAQHDSHSGEITLSEISRCVNQLVTIDDRQCWDLDALERFITAALENIDRQGIVPESIGIDTWAVDYVLLDAQGGRVGPPVAYRDDRTHGVMAQACRELGLDAIYQRTGIQFLPFNTLYQLRALCRDRASDLARVAYALLIPDYLHYRLTGQLNWEYTNATTTQMLNITSGEWDAELLRWSGANPSWFGKPSQPGRRVGVWSSPSGKEIPVVAVATHDTASAVLATPLNGENAAYLSSGTWSLMGFESRQPFTSQAAQDANITNEGGAEGRFRVLKNIMGLWLLQRVCDELAITDLCQLIADAERQPACQWLINANDERFINPSSMVREIQDACARQQMPVPATPAELARCIFDSLAFCYRQVLLELEQLRGRRFSQLHIVGGGCQNQFLNQLCADACGIPVFAGPVEASTLGNIGSQLIAAGAVADVTAYRQQLSQHFPLIRFDSHGSDLFRRNLPRFQSLTSSAKELCI